VSDEISQDVNIRGEGNIVFGKGDVIIDSLSPAVAQLRRDLGILLEYFVEMYGPEKRV